MDIITNIYNSLTVKQRKLIGIYSLSAVALAIFTVSKKVNSNTFNKMYKCFINTPKSLEPYIFMSRGSNYYLNNIYHTIPTKCLLTGWALSHVALYMILGYVLPDMFWETFFLGVLWEILECIIYSCHDVCDILWNTIGFLIGMTIYKLINNKQ
jgi:hypothetical protein